MSAKRSILTDNYLDVGRKDDFVVLKQLAGDVATASVVALGIAPFISIIDKSVVQRAAGTHTVGHSLLESIIKISRNPITFLRSPAFLLMWGVYGSTYATGQFLGRFRLVSFLSVFTIILTVSSGTIFLPSPRFILFSQLYKNNPGIHLCRE